MSLGIDHPLLAVRDMSVAAATAQRLGFTLNPLHQHPWGTCNHLLIFDTNMVEIISVDRPEKTTMADENGFHFGAFIESRLKYQEGIAMTALEAADMPADHAAVRARGFDAPPPIVFRRVGHGSDGSSTEVAVSLNMLMYTQAPWLSQFLCQQHNPALLRANPQWQRHTNTVRNIDEVWIRASDPAAHRAFFAQIHGESAVAEVRGGFSVRTDKGTFFVVEPDEALREFPSLQDVQGDEDGAVALRLGCESLAAAQAHWEQQGVPFHKVDAAQAHIPPAVLGNTVFAFRQR